jgi:hypothetical protein
VALHWTDWAAVTVFLGAACVVIYAGLFRALRRAVAAQQLETERQMNALATTVKALQARVAELACTHTEREQQGEAASEAKVDNAPEWKKEPMKPEIVAALTAAATAFLGKKASIRSAQPLADDGAGAWAQQGRVIVQTSHNLRSNG